MNEVYIDVRKLSAEELQADSLKRLERLTENTPMAERDALRQQLATVAQERDGAVIHYNKILTEAAERVGDAEAKVAALTHDRICRDVFDEVIAERDELRRQVVALIKQLADEHMRAERLTGHTEALKLELADYDKEVATLAEALKELIGDWQSWKSECWNPANPHALTCQTSPTKPCENCAMVIQARRDCADELSAAIAAARGEE